MTFYRELEDGTTDPCDNYPGSKNIKKTKLYYEPTTDEEVMFAIAERAEWVEVSTVFLAIDHSFGCSPPVLYETMVFAMPEFEELEGTARYSTRAEAEAGHEETVRRTRAWMNSKK